ncbi:hypothetical protein [Roseateles sp. BYS96W]|uniref:DUF3137 domain-containing protein n=1 Tax=Pelomonas nitida TaxID=3299027 RepID=A0ABW7G609_9BURK
MPSRHERRRATAEEQDFLQAALRTAPTSWRRWRLGVENAVVLWAGSLLGCVLAWWGIAWLVHRAFDLDVGMHGAAAAWILSIAVPACALLAMLSSWRWVQRWPDFRPSLAADLAACEVVAEHYEFDAVKCFQEPEHGGRLYFFRTLEGDVLVLDDISSRAPGRTTPACSVNQPSPRSKLVLVRAPRSGWIISQACDGEVLDVGEPVELAVAPEYWPAAEALCGIPWDELESRLGQRDH